MAAHTSKATATVRPAHLHPKRRPVHYSHRSHTGKRLPFHQTSYALLFFVILFTIGCLVFVRNTLVSGQSASGSVQISGLVAGVPPSVPATIDSPVDNERFSVSSVVVSGTCDHDYILEVYRNAVLAGSTVCSGAGEYSLLITLVSGENVLLVRTRDVINQYGPDSPTISVFYDMPVEEEPEQEPAQSSGSGSASTSSSVCVGNDLLVRSKSYFRVDQTSKRVRLTFNITDGCLPYKVVVRWGDGQQTERTLTSTGEKALLHTYKRPGQYRVSIQATDSRERRAVFQTVVVVDGVAHVDLSAAGTLSQRCQLDAVCIFQNQIVDDINRVWPVFIVVSIMTLCFWMGERVAVHAFIQKRTHNN